MTQNAQNSCWFESKDKAQFDTHPKELTPHEPGDLVVVDQLLLVRNLDAVQVTKRLNKRFYVVQPEKGSLVCHNEWT